ncbi:MAG: 6-phosphogluconolactonase [Ferrimicrobium sp.]
MFTYEVCDDIPKRFSTLVHGYLSPGGLLLLSGGSTIRELLSSLAPSIAPSDPRWKIHLGQVDERVVPFDNAGSNWRTISEGLTDTPIAPLPMVVTTTPVQHELLTRSPNTEPGTDPALGAFVASLARRYEERLLELASWDVVHLGLGLDGHTASIFPSSPAEFDDHHLVARNWDPSGLNHFERVSLTMMALNRFNQRIVVATGSEKAEIVHRAITGEGLPIHRLDPNNTIFLLDKTSAHLLN